MNNRNGFSYLINGDWRQRSTAKASFARNTLIMEQVMIKVGYSGAFAGSPLRFHILN
jgi:hypothetical protein